MRFRFVAGVLLAVALLTGIALTPVEGEVDLLIRGGSVLDGSAVQPRTADIAIDAGRIVALEPHLSTTARREIDANGLTVTPGFIDGHSHAAGGLYGRLNTAVPLLAQGITSVIINPDGGGPVDLAAQASRLAARGVGVNVAQFVPHGSVRRAVIGMVDRAPTASELARMTALVVEGMRNGAIGLSSGLYYAPGSYASTAEMIALARAAAADGGVYSSHIRDESDYSIGVVAAVDEAIRIAEGAQITAVVSHLKALGPATWGKAATLVDHIARARERGLRIFADQYPYDASGTTVVAALVPRWAEAGGSSALRAHLAGGDRERLLGDIRTNLRRRGGPATLVVSDYSADRSYEGLSLEQIARKSGQSVDDVIVGIVRSGDAGLVSFNMSDEDIELIMRQPWTMTCTDGDLRAEGDGKPHPRGYGAFARKLAVYARERGVLTLSDAVRSMTSLPASVYGLKDRGTLAPGTWADVLVFDPARISDRATYASPQRLATGMKYAIVNGVVAIDDGRPTGATGGRLLQRGR
jgi:N-acyl-D-amino-acid deacylase